MTDKSKVEEVTEGEKIWNEIKGKTIDIFALPDQVVINSFHPSFM